MVTPETIDLLAKSVAGLVEAITATNQGINSIVERVSRLESARKPSLGAAVETAAAPASDGMIRQRCEGCNEIYQGPPIAFGSARQCPECAKPGRVLRQCSKCGKRIPTEKSSKPEEIKCKKCAACVICGDQSSDEVCKSCQQGTRLPGGQWAGDGVVTCSGCNRLPMAGSAFCKGCDNAFNRRNASQFEVPANDMPNRVLTEGTWAGAGGEFGGTHIMPARGSVLAGIPGGPTMAPVTGA